MNLVEMLKAKIGPKITVPGMTDEQRRAFLARNTFIGGEIRLQHPDQLDRLSAQFMLGARIISDGEMTEISAGLSLGNNSIEV